MAVVRDLLGAVFLWFYCLPLSRAFLLLALAGAAFLLCKRWLGRRRWWKGVLGLLLLLYLALVAYSTLVSRESGGTGSCELSLFHSYREVMNGGSRELLRSNFMNVALFFPAGLLAAALGPEAWPRWLRVLLALAALTLLSAGIEWAQYAYALGRAEVDDVFHNALGAALGTVPGAWELHSGSPGKKGS